MTWWTVDLLVMNMLETVSSNHTHEAHQHVHASIRTLETVLVSSMCGLKSVKSTAFRAAHRRNWTTETSPKRMESSGLYMFNWMICNSWWNWWWVGVLNQNEGDWCSYQTMVSWLTSGLSHGGLECTRILNEITDIPKYSNRIPASPSYPKYRFWGEDRCENSLDFSTVDFFG